MMIIIISYISYYITNRMHLVQVLQTLRYNKLASSILPAVKQDSDTST